MAATDQVYRNQKTLNVVFAVSCVLMLLSVIWMLVDDYNRPFKAVQREFRDVEAQLSVQLMLDNMPPDSEVRSAVDAVKEARDELEAERKRLNKDNADLIARRDKADAEYQKWKADYDAVMSYRNIAAEHVGQAVSDPARESARAQLARLEERLKGLKESLDEAEKVLAEARREIDEKINAPLKPHEEDLARAEDALKRLTGLFDRHAKLAAEKRWKLGDSFRNLPILDAFAAPTRIDQIVLEDLPWDAGGFKMVTRYDRCATCHLGIDRASFDRSALARLKEPDEEGLNGQLETARELLLQREKNGEKLGFDPDDLPKKVRAVKLSDGQVTQFAAHPRLDLFVDGNSPHPKEKFGCTICHGGQGSATDFYNATHTPNDAEQKKRWQGSGTDAYHWHSNHYWDFPMQPKRFVESGCVKCHHQMTDLIRFGSREEAPRLLEGYRLVRDSGCFGCHEIHPIAKGRPVGPDLRLEPTPPLEWLPPEEQRVARADAANPPGGMRKVGPSLRRLGEKVDDKWLLSWLRDPRGYRPSTKMPHFYGLSTNDDNTLPDEQKGFPAAEIHGIARFLLAESKSYLGDGKEGGADSTFRAVRAQLEELHKQLASGKAIDRAGGEQPWSEKNQRDLIALATRFRDLSLMSNPRAKDRINDLFARFRLLEDKLYEAHRARRNAAQDAEALHKTTADLAAAARPTGALAGGTKLIDSSGAEFDASDVPAEDKTDRNKGKGLFVEKGCVACHSHAQAAVDVQNDEGDTVRLTSDATFAPDLSRVANKLPRDRAGRLWLVQWILNPNLHHPRTRMPVTQLSVEDATQIADWLRSTADANWKPLTIDEPSDETVLRLARVSLEKSPNVPRHKVEDVLNKGLTEKEARLMPFDADEQLLVGKPDKDRLLRYVGKKAINRLGCYGCHDVAGFEAAKPVGTPLNDWGKKDPERLAFEDATAFVKEHFNVVPMRDDADDRTKPSEEWQYDGDRPPFEGYFFDALEHHRREGFLHLKLSDPRSYDFNRIRTWDDRLRMPQFQFSRVPAAAAEKAGGKDEGEAERKARRAREEALSREAVMTFVLGLVADPIPLKFLHTPKRDRHAEVRGREVMEKYNCAGCHQLRAGVYEFRMDDPKFRDVILDELNRKNEPKPEDHVFEDSNAWRGRPSPIPGRLVVKGVDTATLTSRGTKVLSLRLTEALRYTDAQGVARDVPATTNVRLPLDALVRSGAASEPFGGDVLAIMGGHLRKVRSVDIKSADEARNYSPPPLLREGEKVQPGWLYRFLLDPEALRPLTVLRMPRFNMSEEEARVLADAFAAVDRIENPAMGLTEPFLAVPQREREFWRKRNADYVAGLSKEQLGQRRKEFQDAWWRAQEALAARLEQDLTGAEATLKSAPKDREAEAKTFRDQLQKELDAVKKRVKDKDLTSPEYRAAEKLWEEEQVYAADAHRLVTDARSICLSCHSVGERQIVGEKGPNLALSQERLRPEWLGQWIANPHRMLTYQSIMVQNFPANAKVDPAYAFLEAPPRDFALAARDALMDLRRLADLPVNRYRLAPKGGR